MKPLSLLALLAFAIAWLSSPPLGRAQPAPNAVPGAVPAPTAPSPESWAGQLDALGRWLSQRGASGRCVERCYTLEKLRLTGKVEDGPLHFELRGGVLADGPVAIPLFGPPTKVRIDGALEDTKDASIGFEGDRYYLFTSARRFTLTGTISLDADLALSIPGPLNTLDADLEGGGVVEGSRLSGLSSATIHFKKEGSAAPTGPTVFQLSRAIRVGKEVGFLYKLVMRSGADLGVVRLPLEHGEKVIDVGGSSGWRVEENDLVLPTSGRSAEVTISGSLPKVVSFGPDARSGYEFWLFESDPEHRVIVKTDARQVDSAESPIPRTQATSRLYLVHKGQTLEANVEPLAGAEVLAAVVRAHSRMVVLTRRGDLVSDDSLSYENNGIDYLLYSPASRPIFLATDGKAERIMHQGNVEEEMLIPLLTGSHSVKTQALGASKLGPFGGALEIPMPSYPLTASSVSLTVGLPEGVLPLALLGGDRSSFRYDDGDLFALLVGFLVGAAVVRPEPSSSRSRARGLRALGGLALAGTWLLSPGFYTLILIAIAVSAVTWVLSRFLKGGARVAAFVVGVGMAGVLGLIGIAGLSMRSSPRSEMDQMVESPRPVPSSGDSDYAKDKTGNIALQQAVDGGILKGVTPVALSLPSYRHSMRASRELVTRVRPFSPTLYYVTEWALLPFGLFWLSCVLWVGYAHRPRIAALYRRIRDRLDRGPTPPDKKDAPAT